MEPSINFKPAVSLTEQIANHLGDEIIIGKLAPAQRIQELKVAKSLGVSRGSVREALLILEGRHLIEIIPRRGAVVSGLHREQVESLFEITSTLLAMLTTKATRVWRDASELAGFDDALKDMEQALDEGDISAFTDATGTYFRAAFPLSGNGYLQSIVEDLLPAHQRLMYQVLARGSGRMEQDLAELREVLAAIRSQSVQAVEDTMSNYSCRQRERALELLVSEWKPAASAP